MTMFDYLFGLLIFIMFDLVFARIFLQIITIRGSSMTSTLDSGDRVLVMRYWPARLFKKDHIVVGSLRTTPFAVTPLSSQQGESIFIKRLIGLPGDTINIHISKLPDNVRSLLISQCDLAGNITWSIPQGHCFVRGDAHTRSIDSVLWGPIPISTLWGIVLLKLPRKNIIKVV